MKKLFPLTTFSPNWLQGIESARLPLLLFCTFFATQLLAWDTAEPENYHAEPPTKSVMDDNPPVARCKNATVYLDATGNVSITGSTVDNGSFDDMGPVTLSVSPSTFGCSLAGMNPNNIANVTLTATDNIGQQSNCIAAVTVVDNQIPVFLNCPPNLTFGNTPGLCGTTPTWSIPSATDNCNTTVVQIAGPTSGQSFYPVGFMALVGYKATDVYGNSVNCLFNFMVKDNELPIISCSGNIVTNTNSIQCGAVVTYAATSATDNCGLSSLTRTTGLASGSFFPVGATVNTFRATDANGLTATCSFTVTVDDNQIPNITCSTNIITSASLNMCGAVVTYAATSATDNCGISSLTRTTGLASGSFFPVGATVNTFRATDANGLTATCSFTVTVNDTQPPSLTCPPNAVYENDPGLCGATKTYPLPIALDNCSISGPPVLISGLASGSFFPVGTTTNTWRVADLSNTTATCSFTIKVNDVEKPKITCKPDILRGNDFGYCQAKIQNLGQPVFSDNCAISGLSNNAPITFPVGSTTVLWIISDHSGNTNSCTQNVTIEDREPPVVTCPANIQVKTDEGDCVATIGFIAKAKDNCGVQALAYDIAPFSQFNIGLTNVQATATDAAGNSVHCVFQISVTTRTEICNGVDDDCDGLADESEDWERIAKRFSSDPNGLNEYGISVDIDGDYAIVGANQKNPNGQTIGAAYLLFRNQNGPNAWGQITKLDAPGLLPGDNFGASVAIAGGVAVVGSPLADDQIGNEGSVSIFYQNIANPDQWDFVKKITALDADASDHFGASVALDGDRLLVGANHDDESGTDAGAAYIFYQNHGGADQWGQVAKLLATTGNTNDNFGVSVALDGEYAMVGANGVDGLWQDAGAAYIFGRNQFGQDAWGQISKLRAAQSGQNDNFGASVAISGPWAFVGADRNDLKGADAGAAFAFYKNQNGISDSWGQRHVLLDYNGHAGARYGSGVAIDGGYAVVSAKGDDDNFGEDSGTGFVYLRQDDGWVIVGNLEDGGGKKGDALGTCAAISGRTAILGAPLDDETYLDEGAALVFAGLCSTGLDPDFRDSPKNTSEPSLHCYPVPFSSELNIEIKGVQAIDGQIVILNALGQTVAMLHNGKMEGDLLLQWRPGQIPAGIYFLRVVAGRQTMAQKIMLER
ncbi:MAG: HYR domain-containing protein [Lewinellaceae bacterium]|nr:HYR domain-containing protein [Lewinellaceae bacterium]